MILAAVSMLFQAAPPAPPQESAPPEAAPRWAACVEEASWRRDDWSEERPGAQRLGDLPPAELFEAMRREIDRCEAPAPEPRAPPASDKPTG
jgi:hypothetical protein